MNVLSVTADEGGEDRDWEGFFYWKNKYLVPSQFEFYNVIRKTQIGDLNPRIVLEFKVSSQ